MTIYQIVCGGPGPHTPASGVLGTSDTPPTADVRCAATACVKPIDVTVQNQQTLQSRAQAALTANTADIAQDQTLITQAATVTATSGTLTTTQLSNMVRQLAQAVAALAANDTNRAKEVNALIRLALGLLDTTDGT